MTYGEVKKLTSALLTGDFVFPEDEGEQLMLLSYAYQVVATEADALKLFTTNKDAAILEKAQVLCLYECLISLEWTQMY